MPRTVDVAASTNVRELNLNYIVDVNQDNWNVFA